MAQAMGTGKEQAKAVGEWADTRERDQETAQDKDRTGRPTLPSSRLMRLLLPGDGRCRWPASLHIYPVIAYQTQLSFQPVFAFHICAS